jgi:exonuclease SbcC
MTQQLADLRQQRIDGYADQDPDVRERALQTEITLAEQQEQSLRHRHQTQQQAWHKTQTQMDSLTQAMSQRQEQLIHLEANGLTQIKALGFQQEADFIAACLSRAEINALSQEANHLDTQQIRLKAMRQERENWLQQEEARQLTNVTRETLETSLLHDQQGLMQQQETLASLKHRLAENAVATQRLQDKQHTLRLVEKDYQRWTNLHSLIGSADGKKYRNFAQGLTFALLVHYANQQLQTMSDRYLLIRDEQQPLELNVIDRYQAGEIRSTKNLSGGESFIISLALALGLSQMASHKVRVDSLFLDEGFGTLDDEALNTALDTLANLQQDGKLIGVISHVPALKERITAQVNVIPKAGGKSILSGVGCRSLQTT